MKQTSAVFTWVDGVHVQHAPLSEALQFLHLHLVPGDVGHPPLHVPELLMGRLDAFIQRPGDL